MRAHWYADCPGKKNLGGGMATYKKYVTCWSCKYRLQRERAPRNAEVRKPPRPPFEKVPKVCNMCGGPLPKRRQAWCSDDCVALWFCATSGSSAYGWLVKELGHVCWECGARHRPGDDQSRPGIWLREEERWIKLEGPPEPLSVDLFVDHRKPLWSLSEEERTELRWWLPFNLQLLCGACHKVKTRLEAGQRAAARRTGLPVGARSARSVQETLDM